jgi:HEAT repeat protein
VTSQFITQLGSRDHQQRAAAERKLQEMGADGVELLLAFLKDEKPKVAIRRGIVTFILIFVASLCLSSVTRHWPEWLLVFKSGCTAGVAVGLAHYVSITRTQKRATVALSATDDVRAVGALIDALIYPGKETKRAVTVALTRLLPRLQRSDAALITAAQRKQLNGTLSYIGYAPGYAGANADFILALLTALGQIGDVSALPGVKKLAAGGGIARREARVREAATRCLPFLVEQSAECNSQTLLRASTSGAVTGGILLRPATGVAGEPYQLLRASSDESE